MIRSSVGERINY